jgi:hypothetical protein
MKQKEESFNKLSYAFALYVRQQNERVFFGGTPGYNEVCDENSELAKEVLPILERHLDEDLVQELNHVHDDYSVGFARAWSHMANFWTAPGQFPAPFSGTFGFGPPYNRRRDVPSRYSGAEVNKVIADFTIDLNNRRTRDTKKFTQRDLQTMMRDLEKDLQKLLFKDEPKSTSSTSSE